MYFFYETTDWEDGNDQQMISPFDVVVLRYVYPPGTTEYLTFNDVAELAIFLQEEHTSGVYDLAKNVIKYNKIYYFLYDPEYMNSLIELMPGLIETVLPINIRRYGDDAGIDIEN